MLATHTIAHQPGLWVVGSVSSVSAPALAAASLLQVVLVRRPSLFIVRRCSSFRREGTIHGLTPLCTALVCREDP
ncbi:hypothetical protein BDQ94DRAFT_141259 [Aspergillus welwitschiae]|uniref:Uncharacterized protein n=1 Tax=Aspergillus welwitschiae TaxID=1341132 RepID=A0A3F3Q742_9EURO|nr:hypothetical protein BDQ94DRAFT_141259 [Aspergillus welwitschiae]RDH34973.1 hypothetical protein BDQ94DRAFT_141259 [Aspergillus welwitschiae]